MNIIYNMPLGKELSYDEVKEGQKRIFEARKKALVDKILKRREEKKSSSKKEYEEEEIMKGSSDLVKKGSKYAVETEMNVKKGLEPKVKRALKKSVVEELDKKIKGSGLKKKVKKIDLDFSSDEEPVKRKRGRPKKGGNIKEDDDDKFIKEDNSSVVSSSDEEPDKIKRGRPKKGKNIIDDDSSSDEEDLMEYSKILKHLISHITDKKEKLDKKDVKQAKELIDKIKSKKA